MSYASEDRDRIMPVVRALEATGWSIFWDRTIPVGETWQRIIGAEIEACPCMVVIWSATSINKEWVYEEASEGKRRGVLAPVLIDDIIPPIGFRTIQAAKLGGWNGKAASTEFDRLVKDISRMLGTPPGAHSERPAPGPAESGVIIPDMYPPSASQNLAIAFREDSDRIQFVSIGIHDRSDKYWREGEFSEHRSKKSNKAAQYFHMTVFESDSDFRKEHRDPVNADPLFDITVKNESARSVIFRKVGIVISVVANSNYLWGNPSAVRIPVSENYAVEVPNLRERLQYAFDGFELKPKRLDEVVSMRVPDPYTLEPEAPFRYTLRLKNYCENMPNHARLQMWCDTDHGEFRSGEIALLRY